MSVILKHPTHDPLQQLGHLSIPVDTSLVGVRGEKGLEVLLAQLLLKGLNEEIDFLLRFGANVIDKALEVVEAVALDLREELLLVGFRPEEGKGGWRRGRWGEEEG